LTSLRLFLSLRLHPPTSTLFPYTTLFRSPFEEQDTLCAYLPSTPFVYSVGATQPSLRRSNSSSETSMEISLWSESIVTISPSFRKAIGPPDCASGAICPTTKPCVPPENLPSVNKATFSPKPFPTKREETESISGIPGPPLGPVWRMTRTSPSLISLWVTASVASASVSNTRAGPVCLVTFTPDTLATAPLGAKLPFKTINGPSARFGLSKGIITSYPSTRFDASARFSAIVLPVTVKQSPWRYPASYSIFMTAGVPPALCRSCITYLPLGLKSARCGTFS